MRPSKIIDFLAVPGTGAPLSLIVTHYGENEPYNGWIEDRGGRVWGRLDAFKFHFVGFDPISHEERHMLHSCGSQSIKVAKSEFVSPTNARIEWSGPTIEIDDYIKGFNGTEKDCAFTLKSSAPRIELLFHAHGWSGIAEVEIDGECLGEVDLFNQENSIIRRFEINNPEQTGRNISVKPTGRRHISAQGHQVLIEGLLEFSPDCVSPTYSKISERNRGGDFRPRFFEICENLPEDAIILDVGGGRRQLNDPRYLNLEYSSFEEPDIFGDATALPFKTNSIDFIYSAAVLEHVKDPLAMGSEIHRVVKPGGRILVNSAFMQPVHSEGQHFFNLTPYGIDLAFNKFSDRKVWWETSFDTTINWIVNLSQINGKIEQYKIDKFLEIAKDISDVIADDRGMYFASGVWLEGIKKM